jgi:hypothetical protein
MREANSQGLNLEYNSFDLKVAKISYLLRITKVEI